MRKLKFSVLTFAAVLLLSCSSEDEGPEMCCDKDPQEMEAYVKFISDQYDVWLSDENLSERQRGILEDQYAEFLDDPCAAYIEELEQAGASCANPY